MRRVLSVAWCAMTIAACKGPVEGPAIVIAPPTDSIATTHLSAAQLDSAPRLALTEDLRIDGNGETPFSKISAVSVTSDGRVVIADQQANTLRIYERSGVLIRELGGKGGGPGELQNPRSLAVWNDSIFVLDNRGLNVYAPSGDFVQTRPLMWPAKTRAFSRTISPTRAAVVAGFTAYPPLHAIDAGPERGSIELYETDAKARGSIGKLVASFETHDMYKRKYMITPVFMAPEPEYTVAIDGDVMWAARDGYDVEMVKTADGARRRVRLDVPPRPVTAANIESRLQQLDRATESALKVDANLPGTKTTRRDMLSIPRLRNRPVVGRLMAANNGTVWVERADLSAGGKRMPGNTIWDVIDAAGGSHGRVELISNFTPYYADSVSVIGVALDSLDVPSVVRYRIARR